MCFLSRHALIHAAADPVRHRLRRRRHGYTENVVPGNPNNMIGPAGYGTAGYITTGLTLPYTIEFENQPTASAPAQNVVVTEQLSSNLNWGTFQFGTIGFGNYVVAVPAGVINFSTQVNAVATLGLLVDITADLNPSTGLVTVTFTSIDPTTLDSPANPLSGFLSADSDPPDGEGYINYAIQPKVLAAARPLTQRPPWSSIRMHQSIPCRLSIRLMPVHRRVR